MSIHFGDDEKFIKVCYAAPEGTWKIPQRMQVAIVEAAQEDQCKNRGQCCDDTVSLSYAKDDQ